MTKAEYLVNLYCCNIKCIPSEDTCKKCMYIERYREIYGDKEIDYTNCYKESI